MEKYFSPYDKGPILTYRYMYWPLDFQQYRSHLLPVRRAKIHLSQGLFSSQEDDRILVHKMQPGVDVE